jgi:potassium-transporting ATPase KdpC subunit
MYANIRACLWLLGLSLILCCVIYPVALLAIGQTLFKSTADGSLIYGKDGKAIGSSLIAQPFNDDRYFHSRPSAVSYNGAASGASNWGANNYLLRDRVARALGPIVKYASGSQQGQLIGPDIEKWFQQDQCQGSQGIVAQWAQAHSTLAANWVKADPLNATYVTAWQQDHPEQMAQWKKDNPGNAEPKPEDLAVVFFTTFSQEHPGRFPMALEQQAEDRTTQMVVAPTGEGTAIQSIFFDMWRQDHPDADLQPVPADMVIASGSGLDPHITLASALYQLDRVAGKWAEETGRNPEEVRKEIEAQLRGKATAPLGGLAGVQIVNVLQINRLLKIRYE